MSHQIPRYQLKSGEFKPAVMREGFDIPIAEDNLVCVHCNTLLGAVSWTIVSTPRHKGLIAFACREHVAQAMNIIATAFGANPVSGTVTLPRDVDN